MRLNDLAVSESRARDDHETKDRSSKLARYVEKITGLYG